MLFKEKRMELDNNSHLNLGLLPTLGGGLKSTAAVGQIDRFFTYYLQNYTKYFKNIAYFSYHNERLTTHTNNHTLLEKVAVFPKLDTTNYRFYALKMANLYAKQFQKCHVLRVYHTPGGIPALIANRRWGIPFIVTYGYKYHQFSKFEGNQITGFILRYLEPFILKRSTAVIVTTTELQSYVQRNVPTSKIHLIPNGVDTSIFKPTNQQKTDQSKPVILFVGRLNPQKNLFTFLEALSKVNSPFHLRIVGDGPLRSGLEKNARDLGISHQFDGTIPHSELPNIFQSASLFALPSLIEGHPKVLLEAMSSGLPCIVTKSEGNRTLIRHDINGLLTDTNNSNQIAQQIHHLLTTPEKAHSLGQAARNFVKTNYNIHHLIHTEIGLLQEFGTRFKNQMTKA